MEHHRRREISEAFEKLLAYSPLVGIFGHRQVGKTTFCSAVAKQYWTLDDQDTLSEVTAHAKSFIQKQGRFPTVIDECQIAPSLFPALKERVRINKRPGQFVLSGSVRFTSRKAIRESLTGRLVSLELIPMTVSELEKVPLSDTLPNFLRQKEFSPSSLNNLRTPAQTVRMHRALEKYLAFGGLPGLCFVRQSPIRNQGLLALLQLILDRDLRLVLGTKLSLESMMAFLRWIARRAWQPYNAAQVKREFGLAHQTQKSLLNALESIYLIRRLPLVGRSGDIVLLEDQLEERELSSNQLQESEQFLSAIYRNCRAQFMYRLGENVTFSSYLTRGGARIPLVISNGQSQIGIIVCQGVSMTLGERRSADSFLRHYAGGKVLILAPQVIPPSIVDSRLLLCSAGSIV